MTKILQFLKYILLISLIIFNYLTWAKFSLTSLAHVCYLILFIILVITNIKDLLKKNDILNNNTYNILSILIFSIILLILIRALYDPNFFPNNKELINEYLNYSKILNIQISANTLIYNEITSFFIKQNMLFFLPLLSLLLLYHHLNLKKIKL